MNYLYARNRAVAAGSADAPRGTDRGGQGRVVIGGGDTGADCMSNALREGASSVTQLDTYPAPLGSRPREIAGWPTRPAACPPTTRSTRAACGARRCVTAIAERGRSGDRRRGDPRRPADRTRHLPGGELSSPPTSSSSRSASPGPNRSYPTRSASRPTRDDDDRRPRHRRPRRLLRGRRPDGLAPHRHRDRRRPPLRPCRSTAGWRPASEPELIPPRRPAG